MISSLVAGTNFGTVLIWAIVIGAFLKFTLTEGIGRWYMASGETILKGWHMLGRGATWYFLVYLFIVTFVFGEPVALVIVCAALGAPFLPFLAITLLLLLNSRRVAPRAPQPPRDEHPARDLRNTLRRSRRAGSTRRHLRPKLHPHALSQCPHRPPETRPAQATWFPSGFNKT
jgi:hypothetical protein